MEPLGHTLEYQESFRCDTGILIHTQRSVLLSVFRRIVVVCHRSPKVCRFITSRLNTDTLPVLVGLLVLLEAQTYKSYSEFGYSPFQLKRSDGSLSQFLTCVVKDSLNLQE